MSSFSTKNPITWFKNFIGAFWNATSYNWDDSECTWDAVSKDTWNNKNQPSWQEPA